MQLNRELFRPSYVHFHKLTICFLKLSGFDPNMNLSSQVRSERHHCNWVWKLFSWIYSLLIFAVLLANLVGNISLHLISSNLNTKLGVVLLLWNMTFDTQMLLLPLVFFAKNKRVLKMNNVLLRWIKTYFPGSKMSLNGVLVLLLFFVLTTILVVINCLFFVSLPGTKLTFLKISKEPIYFLNSNAFMVFIILVKEVHMEIFEVCLTLIDSHNTDQEQNMKVETPNYFMTERCQQKNTDYENPVIKLFGTSMESEFEFLEFLLSDLSGLWKEFGSVFGFAILGWTLLSAPNCFLLIFNTITSIQNKKSNVTETLSDIFVVVSQLIFSYQIYSVGDAIETKVRTKVLA